MQIDFQFFNSIGNSEVGAVEQKNHLQISIIALSEYPSVLKKTTKLLAAFMLKQAALKKSS